ncbi:nitroreductase [Ketobacter sp.]|uniref:nitroreductase family protein n=1 Tax=Ketobacter sp. TaxID=2083498 RepID=UPI000F16CE67|nr:nitroreductase [Ketobacter sp.]RLT98049.1 MAG: nitroreductase [Ketobacter sp.]
MSNIINSMLERVSNPKLAQPCPDRAQLEQMFKCAVRAPDHGRLRPWRFIVLQGEALVQLGHAFEASQPEADEAKRLRLRSMPLRAPMIIVSIATLDWEHKKVPVWEQQVAVGIATQHLQLAAKELGFGTMWRTGEMTETESVRAHLGLADNEQIIGFLYTGTVEGEPRAADLQPLDEIVEYRG